MAGLLRTGSILELTNLIAMQIRIWKQFYLTPFVRLNIYTKGFTVSIGHRRIGWVTFGQRDIRGTLDTPIQGAFLTDRISWSQIRRVIDKK